LRQKRVDPQAPLLPTNPSLRGLSFNAAGDSARTLGRCGKLKYKIASDLVQPADPAEPKRMNEDDHLHKGSWTCYYT